MACAECFTLDDKRRKITPTFETLSFVLMIFTSSIKKVTTMRKYSVRMICPAQQ